MKPSVFLLLWLSIKAMKLAWIIAIVLFVAVLPVALIYVWAHSGPIDFGWGHSVAK